MHEKPLKALAACIFQQPGKAVCQIWPETSKPGIGPAGASFGFGPTVGAHHVFRFAETSIDQKSNLNFLGNAGF